MLVSAITTSAAPVKKPERAIGNYGPDPGWTNAQLNQYYKGVHAGQIDGEQSGI